MTLSLSEFQQGFIAALYQHDAPELHALTSQPGFEVYRNTVLTGCIDALCDNFPTVMTLVGEPWLRAAAACFARQTPPQDARLLFYGEPFANFLAQFEPARELPYLPDVARLDRLWIEAFAAPQVPALPLVQLAGHTPNDLERAHLALRPSVRWHWSTDTPAHSIWHSNRSAQPLPDPLPWHGEGTLLVGHAEHVGWQALSASGCAFLDACAGGLSLEQAAQHAQALPDATDLTPLLQQLFGAGVFSAITLG